MSDMTMYIENAGITIKPGDIVKLGRFNSDSWLVDHGWYSFAGNRSVCGWYLTNTTSRVVKPLQLPDLDDIYLVES